MTDRDRDDSGRKGSDAPGPMKSDLGRTDDVPDVNASAPPDASAHARTADENVE